MRVGAHTPLYAVALAALWQIPALALPADRGSHPLSLRDQAGEEVGWYGGSYALLIGNSVYTNGWPQLDTVGRELAALKEVLVEQGFEVEEATNTDSEELRRAFKRFIDRHGYERDNRLLFYFAGHGLTRDGGSKAYLVPVDAPQPRADERGFLARALTMTQILAWAREMEAKHALFLFDSCFSGGIFKTRSGLEAPPHIAAHLLQPVRQFITAGSAAEEVPAQSIFSPLLVKALRGAGDLNEDGYVTGTELGMYLHDEVLAQQVGQTPQYGKIRDPELDEGDFIFQVTRLPTPMLTGQLSEMRIEFERLWRQEAELNNSLLKEEVWRLFIVRFGEDDPQSTEDDRLREEAEGRRVYWQEVAAGRLWPQHVEQRNEPKAELPEVTVDPRPVSRAEYERCVMEGWCTPRHRSGNCEATNSQGDDEAPATCVSWEQAATYCQRFQGRLPRVEALRALVARGSEPGTKHLGEWVVGEPQDGISPSDRKRLLEAVAPFQHPGGFVNTPPPVSKSAHPSIGFRCVRVVKDPRR